MIDGGVKRVYGVTVIGRYRSKSPNGQMLEAAIVLEYAEGGPKGKVRATQRVRGVYFSQSQEVR